MIVVLDASAALEISLDRMQAAYLRDTVAKADVVVAPDLYVAEVTNVFWKYHQFQALPAADCERGVEFCLHLIDQFVDSRSLWREALHLGMHYQIAIYDVLYLITARRNGGVLLSLDKQLIALAQAEGLGS